MKNLLTFAFVLALIILSCKKKEEPLPQENATTTGTAATTSGATTGATTGSTTGSTTGGSTTGGSTTGGSTTGGTPANEEAVNGILTVRTITMAITQNITEATEAEAFFAQTPFTEVTPSLGINAGQVSFNGKPLAFNQPTVNSYFLGSVTSGLQGKWSVTGGNGIPAFTLNATLAHPVFHNPAVLPGVIKKSEGATIALNLSDFTSGMLMLTASDPGITIEMGFHFIAGASTITLTPQHIESIGQMESAIMTLQIENAKNETVDGKDFRLRNEAMIKKVVELKP